MTKTQTIVAALALAYISVLTIGYLHPEHPACTIEPACSTDAECHGTYPDVDDMPDYDEREIWNT